MLLLQILTNYDKSDILVWVRPNILHIKKGKKMKKLVALLLALVMLLSLAACGVVTVSDDDDENTTTESETKNDGKKVESNPMEAQFKALGFTSDEAAKMKEIFTTVGIAEINTIQAGIGSGIDNLQSFTCNIYDSSADKGGLSVLFTIEKRQLCFISLNGIPTTNVDYAYINIFGNVKFKTSNGKKSVTLYDIWNENGEIIPDEIGYKAVLDWGNKKITSYEQ